VAADSGCGCAYSFALSVFWPYTGIESDSLRVESIAIIGPKRSGKTSLLNYLIHISERLGYAPINPKVGRMGGCRALLTQF